MARVTKPLGSPAWVREFTIMCNEYGYPSLTERDIVTVVEARKAGVFNDLDPIAVWVNNAFLRGEVKEEAQAEEVLVEAEAPVVSSPAPVKIPLSPIALSARQLLIDKYKKKVTA